MTAPLLNRPLVLETPVTEDDGAGGYSVAWVALGQLWANVRPGTGRESRGEDVPLSRLPLRITVRAAPQGAQSRPRPGQRFRDGARQFLIDAVSERSDGAYLTCNAHEELAK